MKVDYSPSITLTSCASVWFGSGLWKYLSHIDLAALQPYSSVAHWCGFRNRGVDAPFQGSCSMYPKQVVSKKELRTVCGIPYSPQHIARLEKAGQFPKRIRLGQNRVAWLLAEVEEWLNVRIANRDATIDH